MAFVILLPTFASAQEAGNKNPNHLPLNESKFKHFDVIGFTILCYNSVQLKDMMTMDGREELSPTKASKLFKEGYQAWEQKLAELRFWKHYTIIDGHTRKVRPEYYDLPTARKIASAVKLLEIQHAQPAGWIKAEVVQLFNVQKKSRQLEK